MFSVHVKCAAETFDANQHGSIESLELKNSISHGGSIPAYFNGFEHLEKIDLRDNGLQGTIPSDLLDNPNLKELLLDRNELRGAAPSRFFEPCNLENLNIAQSK